MPPIKEIEDAESLIINDDINWDELTERIRKLLDATDNKRREADLRELDLIKYCGKKMTKECTVRGPQCFAEALGPGDTVKRVNQMYDPQSAVVEEIHEPAD